MENNSPNANDKGECPTGHRREAGQEKVSRMTAWHGRFAFWWCRAPTRTATFVYHWAMIFVYQKGMLMTRLGKMARFPGQMRDELTEARFPGLNLDGLANSAGMPPQEVRVGPEAQKESLRIHAVGDEAGPEPEGRARSRGGKAVIRVRQRRNNTRAGPHFAVCLTLPGRQERGLTDAALDGSNQIKPQEWSVASGQWLVASGWWPKAVGETVRSNPVKPSQTCQTQSNLSKQGVLEIMIKIKITIRSSCPEVGPVSAQSNQVKPSQSQSNHKHRVDQGLTKHDNPERDTYV